MYNSEEKVKQGQVERGKTNLVLGVVVDGVSEIFTDGDVEFEAGESPRDEDDLASLRVEGEILDVEGAVRLDQSRVHPQHAAVGRHYRIRHHVLVKFLTRTNTTTTATTATHSALIWSGVRGNVARTAL